MSERGRVRTEPSGKRVRAYLGGELVADSKRPWMVWEHPYFPLYYLPREDVAAKLVATGEIQTSPSRGDGVVHDLEIGGATASGAAVTFPESPLPEIRDLVRIDWKSMDQWFEEDEEVYVHPRDPYKRVDILSSSRRVEVEVDGVKVADSESPMLLFETTLPVRYYLPKPHIQMDLLIPTGTSTECPYKGKAEYWSVNLGGQVHADIAWSYPFPLQESAKIAGLIAFYNEKVDITVDGERLGRSSTPFK